MSTIIEQFSEFAGNGRGIVALPILPDNKICLRSHISTIDYEVYEIGSENPPEEGTLSPNDVMFTAGQKWHRDSRGYTFLWPVDGTLWPDPDKSYRIIVTFTIVTPYPDNDLLSGKKFILVWQVDTKSPTA